MAPTEAQRALLQGLLRRGSERRRFCRSAGRRECGRSEAKLSTNARYP